MIFTISIIDTNFCIYIDMGTQKYRGEFNFHKL